MNIPKLFKSILISNHLVTVKQELIHFDLIFDPYSLLKNRTIATAILRFFASNKNKSSESNLHHLLSNNYLVKQLLLLVMLLLFSFCAQREHKDASVVVPQENSRFYLYDMTAMIQVREQYQKENITYTKLINELKKQADTLLEIEPFSVMNKKMVPPSKNMHDYYSLGRYWWPNPETEDGLPYIRKDGKTNPEYDYYDGVAKSKMCNAVFTLSLAYFYTSYEPYAKKADELISTWFIDPETKMNPHLEYGQAIPGIVEGRGIGIIETGSLLKIVNAIGFLQYSDSFTLSDYDSLQKWFQVYNLWLVTSQKGWDERMWRNNHGSSYDSQVAGFSLFTGEDSIATVILDSVRIKRIDRQIEPDGSQPWELERTKSMSYSIKNIDHLMENAILAQGHGIDLWNYESTDGRSIKKAVRFLIPYMLGEKEWAYVQYGGIESKMKDFKELIWIANRYLDDELIQYAFDKLCTNDNDPLEISLLYPVLNSDLNIKTK